LVSYRQIDQHGIKQVVLHERETSSSGRPKASHGIEEDADYFYTYTRTGGMSRNAKTDMDKYWDFLSKEVQYHNPQALGGFGSTGTLHQVRRNITDNIQRITPATDYEISMGYGKFNPMQVQTAYYHSHGRTVDPTDSVWRLKAEKMSKEHFRKLQEAEDEARRLAELAEQERLKKVRETARPNPKEVEKVEPIEIEPIKEVEKYSPLMIAGVIAVVVILLLKRRRA
jgi:hypothetical protein